LLWRTVIIDAESYRFQPEEWVSHGYQRFAALSDTRLSSPQLVSRRAQTLPKFASNRLLRTLTIISPQGCLRGKAVWRREQACCYQRETSQEEVKELYLQNHITLWCLLSLLLLLLLAGKFGADRSIDSKVLLERTSVSEASRSWRGPSPTLATHRSMQTT
jgi:hypothetical protein